MIPNDPENWTIFTWCLVFIVSLAGGISNWYRRVQAGHARAFNLIELIGETVTCLLMGFVGASVGMKLGNGDIAWVVPFTALTAHFSTRILFQMEGLLDRAAANLGKRIDKSGD